MYHEYSGKQEILLWCHGKGKTSKRSSPDSETGTKGSKAPRTSNYEIHCQKLEEVQEIKDDLKERHGGKYTPEQLSAWAHLLQMGRHDSRDTPPDLPYWKKRENKSKNSPLSVPMENSTSSPSLAGSISPGKRITLRGHCVDQLAKWHDLLEKGAISQEQYNEIQHSIMLNVKKVSVVTVHVRLYALQGYVCDHVCFTQIVLCIELYSFDISSVRISTVCDPCIAVFGSNAFKCSFQ